MLDCVVDVANGLVLTFSSLGYTTLYSKFPISISSSSYVVLTIPFTIALFGRFVNVPLIYPSLSMFEFVIDKVSLT